MANSQLLTTHVSLCSGYGGIDLGLRRVLPGLRTIAYSEIEEFACGLLAARMAGGHLDPAPIWTDLRTFPYEAFHGKVDVLSGGYPCQPFSAAGLRRGVDDPRHLWPSIAAGIFSMRPRVCFFENVEGHVSLGLSTVISDLEELGYAATWGLFSASEIGAPHQRKRVFILAHDLGAGLHGWLSGRAHPEREGVDGHAGCGGAVPRPDGLADPDCAGGRQAGQPAQPRAAGTEQSPGDCRGVRASGHEEEPRWPARPGESQHGWEPPRQVTQSEMGRDSDGSARGVDSTLVDNRIDELRILGNGVVPAVASRAFRILTERMCADILDTAGTSGDRTGKVSWPDNPEQQVA